MAAINCLFLFCIACYLIGHLLGKISSSAYTGLGIVIITGSLLNVVGIAQLLGYHYSYIPTRFYIFFYLLVIGIVITGQLISVKIPSKYAPALNKTANVFILVLCIVSIVNGYVYGSWKKEGMKKHSPIAYKPIADNKKKDIVWLLVDEYASSACLQQQFSFHNPLDSVLQAKGFCVLKTMKSRFNNTLFSLNAIFNEDDSTKPSSFYAGVRSLKSSSWEPLLEASGYRFINLGLFDIGSHAKLADRSGYPQTYLQQLFSGTLFPMAYNDLRYTTQNCDDYNQEVLRRLDDTLQAHTNCPKFIWAHISIPHEPYCRNSHGDLLERRSYDESDSGYIKKSYIEYLQYGNSTIVQLLKKHPELLDNIMIISGDHGPRHTFFKDKSYQTWPLAAIMIPSAYDTTSLRKLAYISQIPGFIMNYLSKYK